MGKGERGRYGVCPCSQTLCSFARPAHSSTLSQRTNCIIEIGTIQFNDPLINIFRVRCTLRVVLRADSQTAIHGQNFMATVSTVVCRSCDVNNTCSSIKCVYRGHGTILLLCFVAGGGRRGRGVGGLLGRVNLAVTILPFHFSLGLC